MKAVDRKIIELARNYMACQDAGQAESLRGELDAWEGDFEEVIATLDPPTSVEPETGWMKERSFQKPGLAERYPAQELGLFVPPDYDPEKAYGVLIHLHGGGRGAQTKGIVKSFVENYGMRDLWEESGRIVVLPSALPHPNCFARWNLPQVDDYISAIIEELAHYYTIDFNNIILSGSSMGGYGVNHLVQRMGDRFASCLSSASSWDMAYWASVKGTPFWIMQGVNDAVLYRRRHGTDIGFARLAKMRLDQAGVENYYREHSGGHPMADGRWIYREWLKWADKRRRDPCFPHVVAVTPRGLTQWIDYRRHKIPLAAGQNSIDFHELQEAPHARWVSIDGIGDETIMYDMVTMTDVADDSEEDWSNLTVKLRRKHISGGIVEAVIRDDKAIEVMARNVTGFTVWLHPEMVDFNDVRIIVRGEDVHRGPVKPSLATLLDSYQRRRDRGLLYPAKVQIKARESWNTKDHVKLRA